AHRHRARIRARLGSRLLGREPAAVPLRHRAARGGLSGKEIRRRLSDLSRRRSALSLAVRLTVPILTARAIAYSDSHMSIDQLFDRAGGADTGTDVKRITLRRPDDWHVHLRDGAMLRGVLPFTAAQFARGIIMPNLTPPITTSAMAADYRARIR